MQESLINFKEHWDKEYESISLINGKPAFYFNNVFKCWTNNFHLLFTDTVKSLLLLFFSASLANLDAHP